MGKGVSTVARAIALASLVGLTVSACSHEAADWKSATLANTSEAYQSFLHQYPKSREAYVKQVTRTFGVVGSPGFPPEPERLEEIAGRMWDRSHNPAGILRQMYAVTASGDRTPALRRLDLPVTVLHGTRDRLVRPAAGRATAKAIPGARLRMFEGMGHDLPRKLWPDFVDEIAATAARAPNPAAEPASSSA